MNKQQYLFLSLLMVFSLASPINCFAMLPVIDIGSISNLVKNFNQLKSQYTLLHQTYENAQQQLANAKNLVNDAEGHYGLGDFMNKANDLKERQWSPDDWKSTLQGLSGGNSARYQQLVDTYQQDHPNLSQTDYQQGSSSTQAKLYSQDVQVNRAAMVNSTYSFNNIKSHLNTVHKLSAKIDQAENTKAARFTCTSCEYSLA